MNPTTESPESLPDYQIAAQELAALWAALGFTAEITGAHAAIEPATSAEGREWAHVAATVTITRQPMDNGHGRTMGKAASASFDWKMGIGLADWPAILKRTHVSSDDYVAIKAMAGHGSLSAAAQVRLAAKYLPAFVKQVNPAEVLARCCADGQEASGSSFEDWAGNFGYDTDSRKAEAVYLACQEAGTKARKLVDGNTFAKLAELANRL
jgi:hypothetical protein